MAIAVYVLSPDWSTSACPPGFTYGILISLFAFFNVFALNQWRQYCAHGRWTRYLFGGRIYILLTLTPKSAPVAAEAAPRGRQIATILDTVAASLLRTGNRVTCLR